MPMLLEDWLVETKSSGQRMTERIGAEFARLEELRNLEASLQEIPGQVLESARQATEYALSRMPAVEGAWGLALSVLRTTPGDDSDKRILRELLEIFNSGGELIRAVRAMWSIAQQLGHAPERTDELNQAEKRFQQLFGEAQLALDHRACDWQPADPARFARGLESARQGKTVRADEARKRFQQPQK